MKTYEAPVVDGYWIDTVSIDKVIPLDDGTFTQVIRYTISLKDPSGSDVVVPGISDERILVRKFDSRPSVAEILVWLMVAFPTQLYHEKVEIAGADLKLYEVNMPVRVYLSDADIVPEGAVEITD